MSYSLLQRHYIESVGGNAHQSALELIGLLEHALSQYADAQNWGYYDESRCAKGAGEANDVCFIGPSVARDALVPPNKK